MKASKFKRILAAMNQQAIALQRERVARGANKGAADLRDCLMDLENLTAHIIRKMEGASE